MLRRFLSIRNELLYVRASTDSTLPDDGSLRFDSKCDEILVYLAEIYVVTKYLQTRGYTLAQCRDDQCVLQECISENAHSRLSALPIQAL